MTAQPHETPAVRDAARDARTDLWYLALAGGDDTLSSDAVRRGPEQP